jgi:hypothetical protein
MLGRLVVVSNRVEVPGREGGIRAGGLAVAIRPVILLELSQPLAARVP